MSNSENQEQQSKQQAKENYSTPSKKSDQQIEEEIIETEKKIAQQYIPFYYNRLSSESRQRALEYEIALLKASSPYVPYTDYYPTSYHYSKYYTISSNPYSSSYYYPLYLKDSQIDYLTGENIRLKDQLSGTERNLIREEIENNNLKVDNNILEKDIQNQQFLYEDTLQKHLAQLRLKEQINKDKINNFININDQEQQKLNQNIENLNFVNQQNLNEIAEQRQNNHKLNQALNQSEQNFRGASTDAEFWKNKTDEQLRQSSADKEKNFIQLDSLRRAHNSDIINQETQKEQLRIQIAQKEQEISITRNSHAKSIADLNFAEQQKRNKEIEAEINRRRAEDIEIRKNAELNLRESIHIAEKNRIIRDTSIEKEILNSHARNLSSQVIQKDIEANDWKNNYSRLSANLRYPSVARPLFYY